VTGARAIFVGYLVTVLLGVGYAILLGVSGR
jgi:hypothetical protein